MVVRGLCVLRVCVGVSCCVLGRCVGGLLFDVVWFVVVCGCLFVFVCCVCLMCV